MNTRQKWLALQLGFNAQAKILEELGFVWAPRRFRAAAAAAEEAAAEAAEAAEEAAAVEAVEAEDAAVEAEAEADR